MSLKPPSQDPNMQFKARLNDELAFRILITKGTEEVEDDPINKPYKEMVRRPKRPLDEFQPEPPTELTWKDIDEVSIMVEYPYHEWEDESIFHVAYADYYPLFLNDFGNCISWKRMLTKPDIHTGPTGGTPGFGTGDSKFQNGILVYPVGLQTAGGFPSTLTGYNNNDLTAQWGRISDGWTPANGLRTAKYVVLGTPQVQVPRPTTADPVSGDSIRNFSGACNMAGTMVGWSGSMLWNNDTKYGVALKWVAGDINPVIVFPEFSGTSSRAYGINDEGTIVGLVGYAGFYENAESITHGVAATFPAGGGVQYWADYNGHNGTGVLTSANQITNDGRVLGQTLMPGDTDEATGWWYYDPDEDDVFLITVPEDWPYAPDKIEMRGINENGWVIGTIFIPEGYIIDGYTRHGEPPLRNAGGDPYGSIKGLAKKSCAVLWSLETGMIDMNTILPEDSGMYLLQGADINAHNSVLVMGYYTDPEENYPLDFREYNRGFIGTGVL